jgi:hypothetical protein
VSDGGLRRILPPPRRRPSIFTVIVRWRIEVLVVLLGLALYHWTGPNGLWTAGVLLVCGLLVRPVRRLLLGFGRAVVTCHRVRSALLQAGATERAGRLPWLVVAWPVGGSVKVLVWLRAGTTADDVHLALPLIKAAAGAAEAHFEQSSLRPDRLVLTVGRPRWGWPTTWR